MFKRQSEPRTTEELIRRGDDYRIGEKEEQSFEQALSYYKRAASKSALAKYLIGTMYESGHGTAQNYKEAAKWYERAMDEGNVEATCSLAFLYESGLGVKRIRTLAIEYYTTASQAGVTRATNNLGLIYKDKQGAQHSDHAAMVNFQKGNLKDYHCQANLASMYEKGLDVKRSCDTAANIFKKAAKQGNLFAKRSLAEMYSLGLGMAQSESIARHLYLECARWGDPMAVAYLKGEEYEEQPYSFQPERPTTPKDQLALGLKYIDGAETGMSVPTALYWIENAAKAGSTTAMYVLGQLYENGYGVDKSINVAAKWYKWGAEKQNGACAYQLAFIYENSSMEDALQNAFQLYRQASESEADEDIRSDAYFALGLFYLDGKGTEASEPDALDAMVKSADLGNASAQYLAATMILNGKGGSEDDARRYLRMASEQGDDRATELLASLD